MLANILFILFLVSCIVLIASVLLQPGKADAGALFANTVSTTAFGARGTQTLLSKITIGAATGFMLTALLLSVPKLRGAGSVIDSTQEQPAPAATPAATTSASPSASPSGSPSASPAAAVKETPKTDAKATPAASKPEVKASPKVN